MNRARGYTGSGYRRRVRRPYGCDDMGGEEGADDGVVVLLRGEVMDSWRSCTAGRTSGRGKEARRGRFNFGVNCRRSKPQSFVTSHQKEYKELMRADSSLKVQSTQCEQGRMVRGAEKDTPHIPETEKRVLAMPCFFHCLLAFLCHKIGHHESLRGG
jgi:hypothetical protein